MRGITQTRLFKTIYMRQDFRFGLPYWNKYGSLLNRIYGKMDIWKDVKVDGRGRPIKKVANATAQA